MGYDYYQKHEFKDKRIKPMLDLLVKVFTVNVLKQDTESLYESGFFRQGSSRLVNDAFAKLLVELRPQTVPIAETFEVLDGSINSVIGNEYGDIYEKMLDHAKNSRLN